MSAKFVDALKGYEYYLKNRGKVSLANINDYLMINRRRSIQLRTYDHYRKLLANGFRSYIPINQFDVFQSLGKIQMAADRRRYGRETTELPAKISRGGDKWMESIVIDKSLVGFGISTTDIFPAAKGSKIWVRVESYKDIPVMVVWRDHNREKGFTRLGVRAFEFITKYRVGDEEIDSARLTGLLKITRKQENSLDWGYLYRIFNQTNELLDAVSSLIFVLAETAGIEIRLARPVLETIKFGSPGETQIKIDFGIADILKTLIDTFLYGGFEKKKLKEENRKRELENANLGIEIARNAVNFHKEALEAGLPDRAIEALLEPTKQVLNVMHLPLGLYGEGSLERAILAERIIPVVIELIAGDDPDFKLSVRRLK